MRKRLLPHKAKYYGLVFIFLIPAVIILLKLLIDFPQNAQLLKGICRGSVIAGFLIIILSREKIEDEFIDFCRLQSFRSAFIIGIIIFIVNYFFEGQDKNSFDLLLGQSIFYLITFYGLKSGIVKYDK